MKKLVRRLSVLLIIMMLMQMTACGKVAENTDVPEDFQFSFTWGTYGISSYDSATGELVKDKYADNPSDYTTTLILDQAVKAEIYNLLKDLNLESYPDTYDPINAPDAEQQILSEPSRTLILAVQIGDMHKTIACSSIAYMQEGYDAKAQVFLDACEKLEEILMTTEEWLALPEFERMFL